LYTWFVQSRSEGVPISGLLQEQVLKFHMRIGSTDDFNASYEWLLRWKISHRVMQVSIEGESHSDRAAAKEFCETVYKTIDQHEYNEGQL
jgi:hypothetical protein